MISDEEFNIIRKGCENSFALLRQINYLNMSKIKISCPIIKHVSFIGNEYLCLLLCNTICWMSWTAFSHSFHHSIGDKRIDEWSCSVETLLLHIDEYSSILTCLIKDDKLPISQNIARYIY